MTVAKAAKPAKGGSPAGAWLPKLRGSAADIKSRAAEDAAQRKAAGNHPKSVILTARDVQEGKYDAKRALETTLGGILRPLTNADLRAFRQNVKTVQDRYTAGIRAKQVIELSLPIDRKRANEEIHYATPVSAYGGKVRFLTNAGPESDLTHHHVQVEFLSYAASAAGAKGDAKAAAMRLRKEPIKIECDCGRWRFWYRYIATIGRFNAGRDETGFPKIRNPSLHGVACKHILRVMTEVESGSTVLGFLARLIDKARAKDDNKVSVQMSQSEAEALINKPVGKIRDVETAMRRRAAARAKAALTRAARDAKKPGKTAPGSRRAGGPSGATLTPEQIALAKQFNIPLEQALALLAAGR